MSISKKEQALNAVKLLIEYIGEDPSREGLKETPKRVINSYEELFNGYNQDIAKILDKRFYDINKYEDIVLLRSINFTSLCEHHMMPFLGVVDIAYMPDGYVLGVSKLARLVNAYSRRLQIQERMTAEIAIALQEYLKPKGVAIRVSAKHTCMSIRGAMKEGSNMETCHFTGVFTNDLSKRQEFWDILRNN